MIIWYAFEAAGAVLAFFVALIVGVFTLTVAGMVIWDKLMTWSRTNGRRSR